MDEGDGSALAHQLPKELRLSRGLAAHPAFFFTLLKRPEQPASPLCRTLVLGDGRDADARAAEPEVCEDALTAQAALRNTFHIPAPYVCGAGLIARSEQEIRTRSQGERATRQARPCERSLRTLTVCDNRRCGDGRDFVLLQVDQRIYTLVAGVDLCWWSS